MNDFDAMIEKYSKELINTRRKSMLSEIEQDDIAPASVQPEPESDFTFSEEPVMESEDAEDLQAVSDSENEEVSMPVMDFLSDADIVPAVQSDTENMPAENFTVQDNKTEDVMPVETSVDPKAQIKKNAPAQDKKVRAEDSYPLDGEGKLKVQVYAANQTYPIGSAEVTVTGKNGGKIFFQGYTDSSGIVDDIILPTVSKEMSGSPSVMKPYEQYDVLIEHPRFVTRKYVGVPIFDGQKSIQTVQLVPTDLLDQKPDVVIESEPNDLLLKKEEV